MGPIEEIAVSRLGQEVRRHARLRDPGTEPSGGGLAFLPSQDGSGFGDEGAFGILVEAALSLRVGAAMPDDLVAACPESLDQTGAILVDPAVGKDAGGKAKLVEQRFHPPGTDAIAPVAPSIVQHVRLGTAGSQFGAEARSEIESLEIERDIDREALPPRPVVDGTIGQGAIAVSGRGVSVHPSMHRAP